MFVIFERTFEIFYIIKNSHSLTHCNSLSSRQTKVFKYVKCLSLNILRTHFKFVGGCFCMFVCFGCFFFLH